MNKQILLSSSVAIALTMATACSSSKTANQSSVESSGAAKGVTPAADTAKQSSTAFVRFVNGTPAAKDLSFGDSDAFPAVHSMDVTEYRPLPAERHDFKLLVDSKAPEPMATDSEGLTAGGHYTVVAAPGPDGKFALSNINDNLAPPSTGKAKVRVINLAPNAANVNLYLAGKQDPFISNAAVNKPTDYQEVEPSGGSLSIQNTMNKRNTQVVKDVQLDAGKLYTILVFGDSNGKLKVKTVQDLFTDAPNGTKP